ncbi:hypothetical protein L596_018695 [Steinernema carpocapsae]|uniref:Homeobox domain-containing protein n=1 Tax=Steinernema carpocapsae TaxID=34508 RepID=A0A4U5N686_STECR|nr:hypothetical protein L596_018695 [Steinernema carpocapsae]
MNVSSATSSSSATTSSSLGFDFPPSGSRSSFHDAALAATTPMPDADHLQRLAQMTQGVGHVKSASNGDSDGSTPQPDPSLYQSAAAAAYVQQYGNWPNYYQQFGQPMNPAAFSAWPAQCYAPPHWPNYAQSKKGRQTYQRYQTSVLESKFQQSSYVSKKQREELRLQTNLTDRQIKIWFQNRRMKAKKEKHRMEDQGEHSALLPANPPKNLADNVELTSASEAHEKMKNGAGGPQPPTVPPSLGHQQSPWFATGPATPTESPWSHMLPPPHANPHAYNPISGYSLCPPNI